MKQFLKIIWLMMVEEWRSHSRVYNGRSFALFPFMVFALSAGFTYFAVNYSTLSPEVLDTALIGIGAFFGLAAGSVGFYGKDAFRNVLGKTNYIIYSSRTLPVSGKKLGAAFLIKDVLYYSLILVMPVALGFTLFYTSLIGSIPSMIAAFLSAAFLSLGFSHFFRPKLLKLNMDMPFDSLTNKALIDVSRSSGGFTKVVFSLGVLTFFYWFFVFFFPVANAFLRNPLLSFAVILGLSNISVYNWLNRFDEFEDYRFLPIKLGSLLDSKKKAYVVLTVPLTTLAILLAYIFYPGDLLLALLLGHTSTLYSLVVVEKLTGLRPNIRLYQSETFVKLLIAESLVIVPLLAASVLYNGVWIELVVFSLLVMAGSALVEEHW
jgi:hypothetical protein